MLDGVTELQVLAYIRAHPRSSIRHVDCMVINIWYGLIGEKL